jgi:glycosyltransferase involved in cell wall biosynthesis
MTRQREARSNWSVRRGGGTRRGPWRRAAALEFRAHARGPVQRDETGRSPLKICMVTTFFGAHSFGGDAAYVDRLAQALCRRGHEVHVFHCVDAFNAVRGTHPLRPYTPPPGLHVHPLESGLGILSPIATQVTGRPWFKSRALDRVIEQGDTDVVHFHNISLVGGPGLLRMGRRAVRMMTAHEHWLICPMHLLWKYDRESCDARACIRCSLAGRRPPQVWRYGGAIERGLRELDALIFPSRHALEEHRRRGVAAPLVHLPYFLPDDWTEALDDEPGATAGRPYIAAAGRLVKMKGFQRLIPAMKALPDVDLRIAGTGLYEPVLRALAEGLPNVRFEGLLGGHELSRLFRGARAVVVPSLFPETFGYVVLEAFAVRTPVVVHRGGGAILETGAESGGGLAYGTETELIDAVRAVVNDDGLRRRLADAGYAARCGPWSETAHLARYFELIEECRSRRPALPPHVGAVRRRGSPTTLSR